MSTQIQLLVLLCIAASTANSETVRLEDEQLTFMLPSGWVAIPEKQMEQKSAEVQQRLVKPYNLKFKYGYQQESANWFSYPFLLIKQEAATRIPEAELRELPTIDLSAAEKQARELVPRSLDNVSIGRASYDPTTRKIWLETKGTVDGIDTRGLAMMELTEKGATLFSFYATADQYAELKPVFLQTALSVTPDPEISYRTQP